jgi:hypothetical protein
MILIEEDYQHTLTIFYGAEGSTCLSQSFSSAENDHNDSLCLQVDRQGQDSMHCGKSEGKVGKPEVYAHRYFGNLSSGENGNSGCCHQGEIAEYSQVSLEDI